MAITSILPRSVNYHHWLLLFQNPIIFIDTELGGPVPSQHLLLSILVYKTTAIDLKEASAPSHQYIAGEGMSSEPSQGT